MLPLEAESRPSTAAAQAGTRVLRIRRDRWHFASFSFFSCVTVALHIGPSKAPEWIAAFSCSAATESDSRIALDVDAGMLFLAVRALDREASASS